MRFTVQLDDAGRSCAARVVTVEDMQWQFAVGERVPLPPSADPADVEADRAIAKWRAQGGTPAKEPVIRWLLRRTCLRVGGGV